MYTANELKKKQEKMTSVLSNLENKLGYDVELCCGVANLIEMIVETKQRVISGMSEVTFIPARLQRIDKEVSDYVASCNLSKRKLLEAIKMKRLNCGTCKDIDIYMMKIEKTIQHCVEQYSIYKTSQYREKYNSKAYIQNDLSNIDLNDIII